MRNLTSQGHLVLFATISMTVNNPKKLPATKQTFYNRYSELANITDRDPLGGRASHNHLAELSMLGILYRDKRNEGRSGGIYYEYRLDVPMEAALTSLEDLFITDDLDLTALRNRAQQRGLLEDP
ncbi:hypothetical protein DMJ13_21190 [halophilic archaeon]|nr:hypothetical protein DMJ13_21190 [halophilic archaeon]